MANITRTVASTPIFRPSEINWHFFGGPLPHFTGLTRAQLLAARMLSPDEMPEGICKGGRLDDEGYKYHRQRNGQTYNLVITADRWREADTAFRCFLGGLLADTRLSLMKGETA